MKTTWILACSLALIATAGLAQPSGLAEIFAPAAPAEGCALPETGPGDGKVLAASMEKAICSAYCGSGVYVTCSYTPPSTCVAVDRNCPSQQGYASCNGVTTYCQPTCSTSTSCTEGALRYLWTGYCCDDGRKEKEQQQCVNGQWQYTGVLICMGPCGPIDPLRY